MGWSSKSGRGESRGGSVGSGSWSKGIWVLRFCCFGMKVEPLILLHPSQPQSVPALPPAQIIAYGKKLLSCHVFVQLL